MATKQLYATGAFRYGTRRLKAGDPVEMIGPHQRLYLHLGKVTEEKPKAAKASIIDGKHPVYISDKNLPSAGEKEIETVPAKAPRKRRAKKSA